MVSNAKTNPADAELLWHNLHQGLIMFQHLPSIASDLLKTDLLDPKEIGILHHLQK
jgi:hypothetical protein